MCRAEISRRPKQSRRFLLHVSFSLSFFVCIYAKRCIVNTDIQSLLDEVHDVQNDVTKLHLDNFSKDVHAWLSPADPSTNYNESLKKRHNGTSQWLFQDARYSRWKKEPSLFLWLNGIPGCGKTVLSSTVIQDLETDLAIYTILYFYFTFTDIAKQTLNHIVYILTS